MRRRGFALLAVLWLVAVVSAAVAGALAALHTAEQASRNRLQLMRGRWAAESCIAIAEERWVASHAVSTDTVDLGRGRRCSWEERDPSAAVDVNLASGLALARLFSALGAPADSAGVWAGRVVEGRAGGPFGSVDQASVIAVLPSNAIPFLTVHGHGRTSAEAPAAVLSTVDGLTPEAIAFLTERGASGRPVASLDELEALLSPTSRSVLAEQYATVRSTLEFRPATLLLLSRGWVGADSLAPHASIEELVAAQADHLAVLQRRMP